MTTSKLKYVDPYGPVCGWPCLEDANFCDTAVVSYHEADWERSTSKSWQPWLARSKNMYSVNPDHVTFQSWMLTIDQALSSAAIQPLFTELFRPSVCSYLGTLPVLFYDTGIDNNIDSDFLAFCGLEETAGATMKWMSWMKTMQNDLDCQRLWWTEAVDLTHNWPLWRLLVTSCTTHS